MKYFIDTHDREKGSFPVQEVTEAEFLQMYTAFEQALEGNGGHAQGAHISFKDGRVFCFTAAQDMDVVRRSHEQVGLPYDSITEVRRVTGIDLRS